jgi:SAM-dependent methyltransferase
LPFRDSSCDTLLAVEVLEHVPDPTRCAAEFARVLRPGGKLLITVPFSAPRHQLPFDFARFTPEGIRGLLERNGFEIELFEARGNGAIATGAMLSHFFLRNFGARGVQSDGSVQLSRWRAPLVLPFVALSQLSFAFFARFTHDSSLSLGYAIVARKR